MIDYGVDLHALRQNFGLVREWFVELGEWSAADVDEIGQGIKATVDLPDLGELSFWAEWMAGWAAVARADIAYQAQLLAAALDQARRERGLHG